MVRKRSGVKLRKSWACHLAHGFYERPLWPVSPGKPGIPAGWDKAFPGQLSSLYMVLVPLILERIKQSSLIDVFPPYLSEQTIKHSLHLSLLPSHPSYSLVRNIYSTKPHLWPTFSPLPSTAGGVVCIISLIRMSVERFQYSLTNTS